jgi:DNA-directed RNA polymerase alpha subunit
MPPENRKHRIQKTRKLDTTSWTEEDLREHEHKEKLQTPIAEMKLPVRVINTLEENNVILAKDLITQSYEALMQMKNFGEKTLREVRAAFDDLGLECPSWEAPPKPQKMPVLKPKKGMLNLWG